MSSKPVVSIVKGKFPPDRQEIDGMVRKAIDLAGGLQSKIKKGSHSQPCLAALQSQLSLATLHFTAVAP